MRVCSQQDVWRDTPVSFLRNVAQKGNKAFSIPALGSSPARWTMRLKNLRDTVGEPNDVGLYYPKKTL